MPCSTQTNDEDQLDITVIRLTSSRGCDVWVTPLALQTVDALIEDLHCKVSVAWTTRRVNSSRKRYLAVDP